MVYDPRVVANFVLDVADSRGLPVTNMALNKVLYFAHGWSLAQRSTPLVSATFEAWQYGPVLPLLYRQFSRAGNAPITFRATAINPENGADFIVTPHLASGDAKFLASMVDFYAPKHAFVLSDHSHETGGPWDAVWNGREAVNPGMVISHALIESHFRRRIEGKNRAHAH